MEPQEVERNFQEIWKLFAETDKRMRETDRKMRETDREIQQTARQMRETDKKLQETTKNVDSLTGKWGKFVEGLVAPAAERLFRERGIRVDRVYQRARARKDGESMEIDVLAVDGEHAVLIEVKSTLGLEDIQEHVERMAKFKTFFPEYADRKAVGAMAAIVIDEGVDRYAYKNGLFVIAQSGDTVQVMNDEKFVPKEW
jgi:hypothetical protein